jgi:SRSO17 transposase
MKTFTPDLDPAVLDRLRAYAARFAPDFPQSKPARWAGVYLQGLLLDGERKSVEPLARRVTLPPGLTSADPEQALQQFVSQSPWDDRRVLARYRGLMAEHFASPDGVFVVDDTGLPKRGRHSVGVSHQYCGAVGKRANCQVAVTVHYTGPRGHFPAALQLHLPDSWTADPDRMDAAGVPDEFRAARVKGEVALDLLDRVRAEGPAAGAVVADAGYGCSGEFRAGLAARGLRYVVGVMPNAVVFPQEPRWVRPAPGRRRLALAADAPRPVAVEELGRRLRLRRVTWREGTKGKLAARFAWVRVWPGADWHRGVVAPPEPVWLLVEEQPGGVLKFALSNLPAGTSRVRAVRLWKQRWRVEQGHQQMKEELGLDHFEGRSWRGFHHHVAMVLLAYGFLLLEAARRPAASPDPGGAGKKGTPAGRRRGPGSAGRSSNCSSRSRGPTACTAVPTDRRF